MEQNLIDDKIERTDLSENVTGNNIHSEQNEMNNLKNEQYLALVVAHKLQRKQTPLGIP